MAVYYFIEKLSMGGVCHGAVGKRGKRCVVVNTGVTGQTRQPNHMAQHSLQPSTGLRGCASRTNENPEKSWGPRPRSSISGYFDRTRVRLAMYNTYAIHCFHFIPLDASISRRATDWDFRTLMTPTTPLLVG
jgi:hypothetical protein